MRVLKNYLYNALYQLSAIIIPLFTIPYVARRLGSEGLGNYSFTYSIVDYALLLGIAGTGLYGSRSVAYARDDVDERPKVFIRIALIRAVALLLILGLYVLTIAILRPKGSGLYMIQALNIVGALLDISWYLMGMEKFRLIVMRNLAIKVAGLILIFTLVRRHEDVNIYAIIVSLTTVVGNGAVWTAVLKDLHPLKELKRLQFTVLKEDFRKSLFLALPQLLSRVYTVADKIILGSLSTVSEVAFYDNAQKVVRYAITFITALGVVMLPRISNIYKKSDILGIESYIIRAFDLENFVGIPIMVGFMAISDTFVPLFFGSEFGKVSYLLPIVSLLVIPLICGNVISNQYLLPAGMEKKYTIFIALGAVVSVVLNLALVPRLRSLGATIAIVTAEYTMLIAQILFLRKVLPFKKMLKDIWKYLLGACVMFIAIRLLNMLPWGGVARLAVEIAGGALTYAIVLFALRASAPRYVMQQMFGVLGIPLPRSR